ncbi:MAG: hypothetical protein RLZZ383_2703 [Pseudomonadota bacterium]|jgi:AcrR family transcriptional regulator
MTRHESEAERRRQILDAARECFHASGFHAARVEDVAKRAGLSKGAVYFYFPSKDALFLALVLQAHDQTYAFLEAAERGSARAVERLVAVGTSYLQFLGLGGQSSRLHLMMSEAALRDAGLAAELQALHQRFVDAVTRILAQGMAEGTFRSMDPLLVATLLKAMMDGLSGQIALDISVDVQAMSKEGFRTILRAVLARPDDADRWLAGDLPSPA